MAKHFWLFSIAVALSVVIAAPAQLMAASSDASVTTVKKKHKRHVARRVIRERSAYPELEPYRSYGFVGEFPGSCAYDRAAGRCMIDLGYGRCLPCERGGRF